MKFIYFAILGLLIFNGVLAITADIFNTPLGGSGIDVNDEYGKYSLGRNSSDVVNNTFSSSVLGAWGPSTGVFSVISGIGILLAIVLGKYIIAAVALFLGLVTALYVNVSAVLFSLYDNVYLIGIYSLVGIVIGLLVIINVIEMFTGQGGDV